MEFQVRIAPTLPRSSGITTAGLRRLPSENRRVSVWRFWPFDCGFPLFWRAGEFRQDPFLPPQWQEPPLPPRMQQALKRCGSWRAAVRISEPTGLDRAPGLVRPDRDARMFLVVAFPARGFLRCAAGRPSLSKEWISPFQPVRQAVEEGRPLPAAFHDSPRPISHRPASEVRRDAGCRAQRTESNVRPDLRAATSSPAMEVHRQLDSRNRIRWSRSVQSHQGREAERRPHGPATHPRALRRMPRWILIPNAENRDRQPGSCSPP